MPWGRPRRTQHGESVMSETDKARGVNLASIEAFTDLLAVPRWCVWYWQTKTNTKTGRKWETKVGLVPGSITHVRVNESVGTTYAVAREAVLVGGGVAGVGWRLLDDTGRVWIDIDKCRDPVTGAIAPWARVLLDWAPEAYREITPSGTGMRLLGVTTDPEPFSAHMKMAPLLSSDADLVTADWFGGRQEHQPRAGIEIYHACARFVTVTGHEGRGRADVDLTELAAWLMGLARAHGGNDHVSRGRAGAAVALDPDLTGPIEDIVAALAVMKNEAVPWDIWNNIGMATVNAAGREAGESIFEAFEAFDAWSEKCPEKYDPEETTERWDHWLRVSPADQLGIGTLMRLAREADPTWRRPSRRPEAEFDVVDLPPGSPSGPATPGGGDGGKRKRGISVAQTEVADAFEQTYRGRLRFDHTRGTWFVWDGTRWKREATRLAFHWASRLARRLASSLGAGAAEAGKASFAAGVERLAQARRVFAVTHEVWDADPWLLGTPGGVVELRTGVMRPAAPEDHITRQTAVAPTEAVACPLWLKFLDEATGGDVDMIAFLQRWFGYCLTGDTSEHALVFVHGDGGNGKGVMINTVFGIMADYVANAVMDTFVVTRGDRHSTDLAMLDGARLVVATEVESGQTWAEARMKAVTGGDPITARFMRQDNFTFTPRFKLTISGNHKPALRGVDHSTRRRFNIVPFTRRPAEPDRTLTEKLVAERPAILRWMIDGCVAWQRDGLGAPAAVTAATAGYFDAQDYFGRWIGERCLLGENLMERPIALLRDFQAWCRDNGENVTDNRWLRGMLENTRGVRYVKTDGIQGVRGIGLKPVSTAENGGVTSF